MLPWFAQAKGQQFMNNQANSLLALQAKSTPNTKFFSTLGNRLVNDSIHLSETVMTADWQQVFVSALQLHGTAKTTINYLETHFPAAEKLANNTSLFAQTVAKRLEQELMEGNQEAASTRIEGIIHSIEETSPLSETLESVQNILDDPEQSVLVKNTLQEYLERFHQRQEELVQSLSSLADGNTTNVPMLERAGSGELLTSRISRQLIYQAIGAASRGLLGMIHAEFNSSLSSSPTVFSSANSDALKTVFKEKIDEFASILKQDERALYIALLNTVSKAEVQHACVKAIDSIESQLPVFARAQANFLNHTHELLSQGKGGEAEKWGSLCARAGALTREAIAAHAAALRLKAEILVEQSPHRDLTLLVSKASKLPFDAKLPNGKNVEISKIADVQDGDFVEIAGFVSAISSERIDGKLVSEATIFDPSSKSSVRVVAVFMDMAHNGINLDAYCRVHGTFSQSSVLAKGESAVEIQRLSISTLKNESWWISFIDFARPWYEYWRNGTHLYWSLGAHAERIAGDNQRPEGAGELIYPPLVRYSEIP